MSKAIPTATPADMQAAYSAITDLENDLCTVRDFFTAIRLMTEYEPDNERMSPICRLAGLGENLVRRIDEARHEAGGMVHRFGWGEERS